MFYGMEGTGNVTPRLKLWNSGKKVNVITNARTSNDGELIALLTDTHCIHVIHLKKQYEAQILDNAQR